jgi:hypothetical protein
MVEPRAEEGFSMTANLQKDRADESRERGRVPYEAPRLRHLGSLRQLTLGSGPPVPEGGALKTVASG